MTSKNSFLVSLKENNKRRIWLYVVSGLIWLFVNPILMALVLSNERENIRAVDSVADFAGKRMLQAALEVSGADTGFALFVIALAVICAIQGFSYLNNKRKVDFYYSVPVSQTKRFVVIYLNSVLIFLIPYVCSILLKILVAMAYGTGGFALIGTLFTEMLVYIIVFLSVYSFVLIAVMLTGSLVITLFATGVFFFFELLAREIISWYQSTYFTFYTYESIGTLPLFHPVGQFSKLAMQMEKENALSGLSMEMIGGDGMITLLKMVLMAVLFTAVAYFCYRIRPAEAAGKPMVFRKTKPVIKILLAVTATMLTGAMYLDIMSTGSIGSFLFFLFFMVTALIISCGAIEVIYELDIKAALHKKRHILIAGGCTALLFLSFQYDWYGYDAWTPSPDQLKSASVQVFELTDFESYRQTAITDVETICELSRLKCDPYDQEEQRLAGTDMRISYQMTNGRTVERSFAVTKEGEAAFNKLLSNEAFQRGSYQIYDDSLFERIKNNLIVSIDSGIASEYLPVADVNLIRELFIQDMEKLDYQTLSEQLACGTLLFASQDPQGAYEEYRYDIYPAFTETIAYLEKQGIHVSQYVNPADIESISVTNYNRNQRYDDDTAPNAVKQTYTDPAQIQEIVNSLYPYNFDTKFKEDPLNYNYTVTVTLKEEAQSAATRRGDDRFYMLQSRIPDFVAKDTVISVVK